MSEKGKGNRNWDREPEKGLSMHMHIKVWATLSESFEGDRRELLESLWPVSDLGAVDIYSVEDLLRVSMTGPSTGLLKALQSQEEWGACRDLLRTRRNLMRDHEDPTLKTLGVLRKAPTLTVMEIMFWGGGSPEQVDHVIYRGEPAWVDGEKIPGDVHVGDWSDFVDHDVSLWRWSLEEGGTLNMLDAAVVVAHRIQDQYQQDRRMEFVAKHWWLSWDDRARRWLFVHCPVVDGEVRSWPPPFEKPDYRVTG